MNNLNETTTTPPAVTQAVLKPTLIEIKKSVARAAGITVQMLENPSRKRVYAVPRQVAMYLCSTMTNASLNQVGRVFGNRHHTTVLFARRKLTALRLQREDVFQMINQQKALVMAEVAKRPPAPPKVIDITQSVSEGMKQLEAA